MDIIGGLLDYIEKIGYHRGGEYAYRKNFLDFGMQDEENNGYRKCRMISMLTFDKESTMSVA